MNDETKAAIERFRMWEFDGLDARDHRTVIDWLDGEPARQDAAREEAVAACAVEFEHALAEGEAFTLTGLATPLADELERSWQETARMAERAEKAEGHAEDARQFFVKERELRLAAEVERDTLRARVAELEADSQEAYAAREADLNQVCAERDALRAQVDAARAKCAEIIATDTGLTGHLRVDCATGVLRAMDRVKP